MFLFYLSIVHDQDTIGVHHRVDTMGDGEHSAVLEGLFDGVLDETVCLCIDGRRGLIQQNDLLDSSRSSYSKCG